MLIKFHGNHFEGPTSAIDGVWVPVVLGWAAQLIFEWRVASFPPAAAWALSPCASPNTWTAYEPLGFRPVAGNALAKSLQSHVNLEHSSFLLAAPYMVRVCGQLSQCVKAKASQATSL